MIQFVQKAIGKHRFYPKDSFLKNCHVCQPRQRGGLFPAFDWWSACWVSGSKCDDWQITEDSQFHAFCGLPSVPPPVNQLWMIARRKSSIEMSEWERENRFLRFSRTALKLMNAWVSKWMPLLILKTAGTWTLDKVCGHLGRGQWRRWRYSSLRPRGGCWGTWGSCWVTSLLLHPHLLVPTDAPLWSMCMQPPPCCPHFGPHPSLHSWDIYRP